MPDYIEYREEVDYTLGGRRIVYLIPTKREPIPSGVRCKFCDSRNLVRYGKYRGVQRYLCYDCGRKGADNDALPRMHTPPHIVGAAVSMFYEGMSFDSIRRQLRLIYHTEPSTATLYRWVGRYSKKAGKLTSGLKPKTGKEWVVDETVLKIGGKNTWFWDVIDTKKQLHNSFPPVHIKGC